MTFRYVPRNGQEQMIKNQELQEKLLKMRDSILQRYLSKHPEELKAALTQQEIVTHLIANDILINIAASSLGSCRIITESTAFKSLDESTRESIQTIEKNLDAQRWHSSSLLEKTA